MKYDNIVNLATVHFDVVQSK